MSTLVAGDVLDLQVFPPLEWPVPGLIPEGLGILASAPKVGKSWLALSIGLGVAAGDNVLGVPVEQRPVLYMALEDGWRRLQDRCRKLLNDNPIPPGITFCIDRKDAFATAEQFAAEHDGAAPLMILDTIGKVKPTRPRGVDAYAWDYDFTSKLKDLTPRGSTLLGIHHDRKAESEDFLHDVSGTNGITGAADFVIVLKRPRLGKQGRLLVTGRELVEDDYALVFDEGRWNIDGNDLGMAAGRATSLQLGDQMRRVLELVNSRTRTTAADVAEALTMDEGTAGRYLRRLASEHQLIAKCDRGVYEPLSKVSEASRSSGLLQPSGKGQPDIEDITHVEQPDIAISGVSHSQATRPASNFAAVRRTGAVDSRLPTDAAVARPVPLQTAGKPKTHLNGICQVDGCEEVARGIYGEKFRCFNHADEWCQATERDWPKRE